MRRAIGSSVAVLGAVTLVAVGLTSGVQGAPSVRAAQSERVIVKAGSSPGTVTVVAKDGRDIPPLRVLSVITSDGTVHPVNKGADFTDANVWREIGGGEICYSGEPAVERTSVMIPENSDLPFDAPPGNWQISTVVLNTASGPHPVVRPEVGDTLSTGERIDNVVVCMDIFYSSAPSPRFLALDDHTADPDPVSESGDSSGGDEASTPAETSEPGESETTEETPSAEASSPEESQSPEETPDVQPSGDDESESSGDGESTPDEDASTACLPFEDTEAGDQAGAAADVPEGSEVSACPNPTAFTSTRSNSQLKVTICHATSSSTNPYTLNSVDTNSVTRKNGHDSHSGDIIPPFEGYPGKNWSGDGLTIWGNGCEVPEEEEEDDKSPVRTMRIGSVTLCDATTNPDQPYQLRNVTDEEILEALGPEGPLFPSSNWGDVVPPFEFGYYTTEDDERVWVREGQFPGINWPDGSALIAASCNLQTTDSGGDIVVDPEIPDCSDDSCSCQGADCQVTIGIDPEWVGSPTISPTASPTASPSTSPTASPSTSPTVQPTGDPTTTPDTGPSPSVSPSVGPSASPTASPSVSPSASPTAPGPTTANVDPSPSATPTPTLIVPPLLITPEGPETPQPTPSPSTSTSPSTPPSPSPSPSTTPTIESTTQPSSTPTAITTPISSVPRSGQLGLVTTNGWKTEIVYVKNSRLRKLLRRSQALAGDVPRDVAGGYARLPHRYSFPKR